MEILFKEKVMTKKKADKKEVKKEVTKYSIEKPNGRVIFRDTLSDAEVKVYEAKGCKVKEV
tara:strand:- start:684 stop:866 length:183 start_codon:yes stop_codon:yes gene_type:complete